MTHSVAFVCSNQNHVRMFTPVARLLTARSREVSETPGVSDIPVHWVALDRYYRHEAELALRENGWADCTLLPRPAGASDTPWEGGPLARVRVLHQGRKAIRDFLRNARPGVIVLGNDLGTLERLFIQYGRDLGIPTLLVQDGVIPLHEAGSTREDASRRMLHKIMEGAGLRMADPRPYGQNGADRIAVIGEAVKRWLISQGVSSERIVVTGQPRYDFLHALRQGTAQPQGLDGLGLPEGQRIILFSSQPYLRYRACGETTARNIWQTVIDGVKGLGVGHHLVAKLHPAEDLDWTRHWLGDDFPPEWTLTRDTEVMSLTFRADALVTVASTTALEAICLGKPVVLLETDLWVPSIPYVDSGAALQARGTAELAARMRDALYDDNARERLKTAGEAFADEYAHAADGEATARVARQILELSGEPR
jgi:hypothetical protein